MSYSESELVLPAWFRIGCFWVTHRRAEAARRCGPDLGRQGCYARGGGKPPRAWFKGGLHAEPG